MDEGIQVQFFGVQLIDSLPHVHLGYPYDPETGTKDLLQARLLNPEVLRGALPYGAVIKAHFSSQKTEVTL